MKQDKGTETVTPVVETPKVEVKTETTTESKGEDYGKKFSELESKIGEQGEFIGQTKEFMEGANVVFGAIAEDPALLKQVQEKIKQRVGDQGKQGEDKTVAVDKSDDQIKNVNDRIGRVEATKREEIVQSFEKEHGIDQLPKEEQKAVRAKIGEFMADFGWKVDAVPLEVLGSNLRKAYLGTHAEKLREEGKLEGFTQSRANENATMGSFSGSSLRGNEGTVNLSEKQMGWVNKLGVDPEKVKKTMKENGQNSGN